MVAPNNPLQLNNLRDVVARQARFGRRSLGTGTRVLLDDLLVQEKIDPAEMPWTAHEEPSHTALAEAITSGNGDAGLGLESTARAKGLGFVPLVQEHFYLVCLKSTLDTPPMQALRTILQNNDWAKQLTSLPGYSNDHAGEVQSLRTLLPWWTFKRAKK
jgi:molybdate-binding protein